MRLAACLIVLFFSVLLNHASADDRQKASKQLRKLAAMATDRIGRDLVSMSMADFLKMPRPALVELRRTLGLDYGSFLLALELRKGMPLSDITSRLKSGETVWQIADAQHANWGHIAADAKKVNNRIDDAIYRHFLNRKNHDADDQRDIDDKYSPVKDAVRTDFDLTPKEIVDAEARYIFWRDRASAIQSSGHLSTQDELSAQYDRTAATHTTEGTSAPPAGGLPSH